MFLGEYGGVCSWVVVLVVGHYGKIGGEIGEQAWGGRIAHLKLSCPYY